MGEAQKLLNAIKNENAGQFSETKSKTSSARFALVGRTDDGRGIYRSNYPENTPKDIKQRDIVDLVQNVWGKKPIKLNLIVDGKTVPIEARFNPVLTERSDLSKIAFGNRKGTASEKRITMNLSSDLYQIAEESHHVGSKTETGKSNAAHAGVTTWHYFLTDLVYAEADGTKIECYMNIDVKQNDSGHWFYSFAIEKGSRPADVLSVVTDESATTSTISIPENSQKINTLGKKSAKIQEKSANAERKTVEKGKKVEASISDELKAAGEFAEANVPEYKELSVPNKRAVRKTIIQAKAQGISDADITTFARFSAKSGINLSFDKSKLQVGTDESGNIKYSDGMYDGNNTIYVNKDSSRKYSSLLFHELTHFLFKNAPDKLTRSLLKQAVVNMPNERRNAIVEAYSVFYGTKVGTAKLIDIIHDEWFAHYTEDVLTDIDVLSFLDSKKPTLKETILRFFSKSANEYKGVEQLSSAARKYATKYRKLFNQIAELNQQNISTATDIKPLTRTNQEKMHVIGDNNRKISNATSADERYALPEALKSLGEYDATRIRHIESSGKDLVVRDYNEIKDFIKRSKSNHPFERLHIGIISDKTAALVKARTGEDITGYDFVLASNFVFHIYDSHGNEATEAPRGQKAVDDVNIENIIEAVIAPDDVSLVSDSTGTALRFEKFLEGRNVAITITSTKKNTLTLKSAWIINEKSGGRTPSANANALAGTPEANSRSSTDNSITENAEKSNTFDKNSSKFSSNSRRALPETADAELSEVGIGEGKKRKIIADYTRSIVYSRKAFVDTLKAIPGGLDLKSETFKKYVDKVWENANTLTTHKEKFNFAHDIAVQIADSIISEGTAENPDAIEAKDRLAHLRSGIGRLTFSKTDISEIKYHADKDGARRILARWGYKKRGAAQYQAYYMEQFVNDIADEVPGMADLKEMSAAKAFIEINERYQRAVEDAGEKISQKYWDATDSERAFMVTGIENALMHAFRSKAEKSKFYKHVEQNVNRYKEQAEYWKTKYDSDKGRDRVLGWLLIEAKKMKEKKLGTFSNATQWKMDEFKGTIEKLSRIEFRGNFNESGTRKIVADLSNWYTKDNPMLSETDFDEGISEMLKQLSKEPEDGSKQFSVAELKLLYQVMRYFNHFVENYNKVWRNGKWIEALPEAKRYVSLLNEVKREPPGWGRRLLNKYFETFADPESVVKAMDNYKSGFFSEIFYELREAAKNADVEEMNVKREYDTFLSDNKKYLSRAIGEEIEYRGVKIPKIKLIGLYLTLGREHSHAGFLYNGFTFTDKNGNRVNADGPITSDTKTLTDSELLAYAKIERTKIWELMSETDRQYASILEYVFNSQCKQLKIERDMQRFGYSNATNEYYYPIKRADTAKNVDSTDIAEDIDHVTNSSFNKNTVTGSAGRLYIESADLVFNRHVKAVCMYAYLTPAIEAYNKLYNMDISGNRNKPISVATESVNVWKNGNTYFKNLISDIQGLPRNTDEPHALRSLRGGYAKFQLGANPKVWVTQFSSLFAASSMLDFDSIIKGLGVKTSTIDLYCPLAELRRRDNSAARAQGVLDKVDKIGNALMKPIGWVDSFVINKLYGACQVQIEKNGVAKVGTTENRRAAGELLSNVILSTQQNSMATERSGAMRSGNEIVRTLTMFSADSMKVIGRVFDSIGQLNAYKTELRKAKEKGRTSNQSPTGLSRVTKTGVIKNDSSIKSVSEKERKVNVALFNEQELRHNARKVLVMEPVAHLTGNEFSNDGASSLKSKVTSFFKSFGNKVQTKDLGVVNVNNSSFSDDRGHGLTRNKIISFAAIPNVLEKGEIIEIHDPADKPYERIVISAPITISNEKYYMGVMVQKDNQSNRMYLHDVITEKATLSFTTEPTTEYGEGIRDKGHLFITSILKKALKINSFSENSFENADERIEKTDYDTKKLYVRNSLKNQPYA